MTQHRIVYSGQVQGVGFRASVARCVESLGPGPGLSAGSGSGLTGWVRNEPDGTVTVELDGDQPSLELFRAQLRAQRPDLVFDETVTAIDNPNRRNVGFEVRA
ncbi:MAG: acylphosphatase [Planctomycetota bacterium]